MSESGEVAAWTALVTALLALLVVVAQAAHQYAATTQETKKCEKSVWGPMPGYPGRRLFLWSQFRSRVVFDMPNIFIPTEEYWGEVGYARQFPAHRVTSLPAPFDSPSEDVDPQGAFQNQSEACWVAFARQVSHVCPAVVRLGLTVGDADRLPRDLPVAPMQVSLRDIISLGFAIGMEVQSLIDDRLEMAGPFGSIKNGEHPILGTLIHFIAHVARPPINGLVTGNMNRSWFRRLKGIASVANQPFPIAKREHYEILGMQRLENSKRIPTKPDSTSLDSNNTFENEAHLSDLSPRSIIPILKARKDSTGQAKQFHIENSSAESSPVDNVPVNDTVSTVSDSRTDSRIDLTLNESAEFGADSANERLPQPTEHHTATDDNPTAAQVDSEPERSPGKHVHFDLVEAAGTGEEYGRERPPPLKFSFYWASQIDIELGVWATPWDPFLFVEGKKSLGMMIDIGLAGLSYTPRRMDVAEQDLNDAVIYTDFSGQEMLEDLWEHLRLGNHTWPPYAINAGGSIDTDVASAPLFSHPAFAQDERLPRLTLMESIRQAGIAEAESHTKVPPNARDSLLELASIDFWLSRAAATRSIAEGPTKLVANTAAIVEEIWLEFGGDIMVTWQKTLGVGDGDPDIHGLAHAITSYLDSSGLSPAEQYFVWVAFIRTVKVMVCIIKGPDSQPALGIFSRDILVHMV